MNQFLFCFLSFSHRFSSKEVQRDLSVSVGPWRDGAVFEETGMIQRGFGERELSPRQFWNRQSLFKFNSDQNLAYNFKMCKLHSISIFIKGITKNDPSRFDNSV